jgi:hypothetical protein
MYLFLECLFILFDTSKMCYYTTVTQTYICCKRSTQHYIQDMTWEYCNNLDWITPCNITVLNLNLIFGLSQILSLCAMCAEIAESAFYLYL